ncbi:MAG: TolC family protein [Deltaproteobacteria bacterium]|nr:TolC family protein [Deltaproteobacteria bacterium]
MTNIKQTRSACGSRLLPLIVGAAISVLFVLLSANEALAQDTQQEIQGLSAEQFLDRVVESNPRLAINDAEVDAAAARVSIEGLWENPSIAYDREEVFESGRGSPENSLSLELPLEISGRRSLMVDSAKEGLKASSSDAVATRAAILSRSMRVYLRAAAWRMRLGVLLDSWEALSKLCDSVKVRTSAGDASGYDLARIEIEILSIEDMVADIQRELGKARLLIGMLIGRPGERFEATDDLTLDGVFVAGDEQGAAHVHPSVVAAKHRVSQHGLGRDAAGRGWVPSLTLKGGAKTAPVDGDTAWGYVAGIALTLPLFDFGQADKERASAELKKGRAQLTATEHQVVTNIAIAREAMERATRQAEGFEKDQLPRLEKLMRRANVSYKEGERPVFELLDAHRTAREMRIRHVDLKLHARLYHIELLEAHGREPGGDK